MIFLPKNNVVQNGHFEKKKNTTNPPPPPPPKKTPMRVRILTDLTEDIFSCEEVIEYIHSVALYV